LIFNQLALAGIICSDSAEKTVLSPQMIVNAPFFQRVYEELDAKNGQISANFLHTKASIKKTPSALRKDLLEMINFLDNEDFKLLINNAHEEGYLTDDQAQVLRYALQSKAVSLEKVDKRIAQEEGIDTSTVTRRLVGTHGQKRVETGAYQILYEGAPSLLKEQLNRRLELYIKENMFDFLLSHITPEVQSLFELVIENWQGKAVEKQIIKIMINNPQAEWKDIYENKRVNLKRSTFYKTLKRIKEKINKSEIINKSFVIKDIVDREKTSALKYLSGNLDILRKELLEVIENSERLKAKKMPENEQIKILEMRLFQGKNYPSIDKENKFFPGRSQVFFNGRKLQANFYEGAIQKIKRFFVEKGIKELLPQGKYVFFFEVKNKINENSFEKGDLIFAIRSSSSKAKKIDTEKYIICGKSLDSTGHFSWNNYKINLSYFKRANIMLRVENDIPRYIQFGKDKDGKLIRDNNGNPLVIEIFDSIGRRKPVRRQLADKYFLRIKINGKKLRCSYNNAEEIVHKAVFSLKDIVIDVNSREFKKKLREVKKALWILRKDLKEKEKETARFIADMSGREDLFEILQNISVRGNFRAYLTFQSAFDAYMQRSAEERHFASLNRGMDKGGDLALLAALRDFGILKSKSSAGYADVHQTYAALMKTPEPKRTYAMLSKRKDEGGNSTLLKAYYKFKNELKKIYAFELPNNRGINGGRKRKSKTEVRDFLNDLPLHEQTAKRLKEKGLWWVYDGAKFYKIPLPKEKDFIEKTPYESYKHKVLNRQNSNEKINPVALWNLMETEQEARNQLIEYFLPIIIDMVEGFNGRKGKYITKNSQYYLDNDISEANLAMIESIDDWHPEMKISLKNFVKERVKTALKKRRNDSYSEKRTLRSLNTPRGNKDGKNSSGKKGPFGGGNFRTIEDTVPGQSIHVDDALERFETMKKAIIGIKNGGYDFLKGTELAINPELLIPRQTKERFAQDFKEYLIEKNILKNIPGDFAIWVIGSMGNIGLARKGESDVNLVILTEATSTQNRDALIALRNLIGSGIISSGNNVNFFLEIGKNSNLKSLALEAPDLVSLLEKYNLKYANNGNAVSVEIMSLNDLGMMKNSALCRVCFHIADNIAGMGDNGILVIESKPGFADKVKDKLKGRFYYDFDYQAGFASNYLMRFFAAQLINLKDKQLPLERTEEQPQKAEQLGPPAIDDDSYASFYILNNKVHVEVNNGSVSLRLKQLLNGEIRGSRKEWREFLITFQGKEIYVDDPIISKKINKHTAALLDEQSDELYELLVQEQQDISRSIQPQQTSWHCSTFDFQEAMRAQKLIGLAI